jgi:small-conductance mechanosensitive channel
VTLLSSSNRNYKRMQERRVAFAFGVLYQTPPDQLEAIPAMGREIIEGTGNTRFDLARLKAFCDSADLFEEFYYVLLPDHAVYMDCQQHINLELCRRFEEQGIGFAYPTRTIHLHPFGSPVPVRVESDDRAPVAPRGA